MLTAMGYRIHHADHDALGFRGSAVQPPAAVAERALAGARSLYDCGMPEEALAVCTYILHVDAANAQALHLSAAALSAAGRSGDAVRRLLAMAEAGLPLDPALPSPVQIALPALDLFNEAAGRGDMAAAAGIIDDLAALFPHFLQFLDKAHSVATVLNRNDRAVSYAARILEQDSAHTAARRTMADHCRAMRDYAGETEHRIHLARAHASHADVPSSVKLHNIFQALSGVLCAPAHDGQIAQAEELLSLGAQVGLDGQTRSDAALLAFDSFYRINLEAFDLPAALGPPAAPKPWPDPTFATADGRPLSVTELQELAEREKAEAVFLLAADELFIARYAKPSVSSILRNADVPCLVILFAAVPVERLGALGAAVGIDDRRVVFCGDGYVPSPAEYRVVNSETESETPTVYFQCMRYLWLGYVLEKLKRPTFVCDIDIVLQRGIRDLLERCSGADVTLNRTNQIPPRLSGHVIANLLLVNPTDTGDRFSRFLRGCVERALSRKRIPAFLDQLCLLAGWLHLQWALSARVAFFDEHDINNVMFTTMQFRFNADAAGRYRFINLYASQGESALAPPEAGLTPGA